jgi:hypothetical protein
MLIVWREVSHRIASVADGFNKGSNGALAIVAECVQENGKIAELLGQMQVRGIRHPELIGAVEHHAAGQIGNDTPAVARVGRHEHVRRRHKRLFSRSGASIAANADHGRISQCRRAGTCSRF